MTSTTEDPSPARSLPKVALERSSLPRAADVPADVPLAVRGLTASYGGAAALVDVSFCLRPATLTAIVGPNGAGKSTLLKAAIGAVSASGDVRFWGKPLRAVRGRVGYVPQRASVDWDFPVTAQQVVAMGLYPRIGWFRPVTRRWQKRALEALDRLGLADLADRPIGQLSGGQQQRVFLARALAQDADLYLMDEPFAGVDAATESAIFALLAQCRAAGKTAVLVHHDLDTVPRYFDDVLLLNRRVIAFGPVAETFTAANLKTAYGGKIAVLSRSPEAGGAEGDH
jgi:manganese/zinc/iron transport system ATP- binding protein